MNTWTEQQKRTDYRLASLQLTIFQSAGVKIQRRAPRIEDFLPRYATTEESAEDLLEKEWEAGMRRQEAMKKAEAKS